MEIKNYKVRKEQKDSRNQSLELIKITSLILIKSCCNFDCSELLKLIIELLPFVCPMWLMLFYFSPGDSSGGESFSTETNHCTSCFSSPMVVTQSIFTSSVYICRSLVALATSTLEATWATWIQFKQPVKNFIFLKELPDPCMILWKKFEKFSLLSSLSSRSTEVLKKEILFSQIKSLS